MAENLKMPILKCQRCGHEWIPRTTHKPATCPNLRCKSPYWDRPYSKPGYPKVKEGKKE